jgi:hypothetical protein
VRVPTDPSRIAAAQEQLSVLCMYTGINELTRYSSYAMADPVHYQRLIVSA